MCGSKKTTQSAEKKDPSLSEALLSMSNVTMSNVIAVFQNKSSASFMLLLGGGTKVRVLNIEGDIAAPPRSLPLCVCVCVCVCACVYVCVCGVMEAGGWLRSNLIENILGCCCFMNLPSQRDYLNFTVQSTWHQFSRLSIRSIQQYN